jgi:hypothetical protein
MRMPSKPTAELRPEAYGPEVLCANWNPVAASMGKAIREVCPEFLADSDGEAFLRQVYRSQRI